MVSHRVANATSVKGHVGSSPTPSSNWIRPVTEEHKIIAKYLLKCCKNIKNVKARLNMYSYLHSTMLVTIQHDNKYEFDIWIHKNELKIALAPGYADNHTLSISVDPTKEIEKFIYNQLKKTI